MRPLSPDRYGRLRSPVHRLPAGIKLALTLAAILVVVLTPVGRFRAPTVVAALLAAAAVASRVPLRFLARRFLLVAPFALGVSVLSLFQPGGGTVFLSVLAKSAVSLFAMVLFSAVTPFSDILRLMRRAHVPSLLVTVLALMARYLFVLVEEAERLKRARASRTFLRSRRRAWRTMADVAAQLFVRSSERGERVYAAMRARGWQ